MAQASKKAATIGELNGRHAFLFRLALYLIPIATSFCVPYLVWSTTKIFAFETFKEVTGANRFTSEDAKDLAASVTASIADVQLQASDDTAECRKESTDKIALVAKELSKEIGKVKAEAAAHAQIPGHAVMIESRKHILEQLDRIEKKIDDK